MSGLREGYKEPYRQQAGCIISLVLMGAEKGHGLCCAPSLFACPVSVPRPSWWLVQVRCYPLSFSARCSALQLLHPALANICTQISEQSVDIVQIINIYVDTVQRNTC